MLIHPAIFWIAVAGFSLLCMFWVWDRRRVGTRFANLEDKVSGVVVPYWKSVQAELIKELTHPHRSAARADELLRRLREDPEMEMCDEDRVELLEVLKRRAAGEDPEISVREQRKAALFPLIMEEVQDEAANPNPITEVQVVGIKKPDV